MTSKAELLPFSAGGTTNVSKCQAVGALALLSGLLDTHTISPACPFGQQFDCYKHKHKPMQERVKYKTGCKKKSVCKYQQWRGCLFNVCATVHTHVDRDPQSAERPKDSRAPVETVISGVKKEGEEEEQEEEILFEPSDICYIMTCTMETCWERK